jgi:hypothetical protein
MTMPICSIAQITSFKSCSTYKFTKQEANSDLNSVKHRKTDTTAMGRHARHMRQLSQCRLQEMCNNNFKHNQINHTTNALVLLDELSQLIYHNQVNEKKKEEKRNNTVKQKSAQPTPRRLC